MVHLGLSWVEIEAATVEEDGCLEVLSVAIAADASLDGHDLAAGQGDADQQSIDVA